MTPTPKETNAQSASSRVSILARIVPSFSYALPAMGAALSALLFINVMQAMRNAESAGIAAVAGGMSEANVAILITLYLAVILGFCGVVISLVRAFSATTTASPSGWFFLIIGILGLAPMLTLWQAESLLLEVITRQAGPGIVAVASQISVCLMLTILFGAIGCLILLVASVVPLPAALRAKRKWAPLIILVIMELTVIGMTVIYHLRTYWFYQAKINEGF